MGEDRGGMEDEVSKAHQEQVAVNKGGKMRSERLIQKFLNLSPRGLGSDFSFQRMPMMR